MNQNNYKDIIEVNKGLGGNFFNLISDELFYIPSYQRPYSWSNIQVERLVDDYLFACRDKRLLKHFIGSLLYRKETINNEQRYTIVDGQQRTTTIYLMYLSLILVGFKAGFNHHDKKEGIEFFQKWLDIPGVLGVGTGRFIDLIAYDRAEERYYYEELIENLDELLTKIYKSSSEWQAFLNQSYLNCEKNKLSQFDDFSSSIDKLIIKLNKLQGNRFTKNFVILYKKFLSVVLLSKSKNKQYDFEFLKTLLNFNAININFVCIEILDDIEAVAVFNDINTSGVNLNDLELIRSYLVCHNGVYGKVLDYIDKILDKSQQKDFIKDLLLIAVKSRYDLARNRKKFQISVTKKDYKYPDYEDFKLTYNSDLLRLREDPEHFSLVIERYFDYYRLIYQIPEFGKEEFSYEENPFYKSLNLNDKQDQKLKLILKAFDPKIKYLKTYLADVCILFERVDPRVDRSHSRELKELTFGMFLKTLHLLWSFVIRVNLNKEYYDSKKISNTTIDMFTKPAEEIYPTMLSSFDSQFKPFTTEPVDKFKQGLISYKYNKDVYQYLLEIIELHIKGYGLETNRVFKEILPLSKLPKSLEDKLWMSSNEDWNEICKVKNDLPDTFGLEKSNDKDVKEFNEVFDFFSSSLGNFIMVNPSTVERIDTKKIKDLEPRFEEFLRDRGPDDIVKHLQYRDHWSFKDIIKLNDWYAEKLFEILSPNNPDYQE